MSSCPAEWRKRIPSRVLGCLRRLIAFQIVACLMGCDQGWKPIKKPDHPWNGAGSRAIMYERSTGSFPNYGTEHRWDNADGDLIPYWSAFGESIKCLKASQLMKPIIDKYDANPDSTDSPYLFQLVSVDPEIVIVSEGEDLPFDYWNMSVTPSTKIRPSENLYWLSVGLQPEPVKIELDELGKGTVEASGVKLLIVPDSDGTRDVVRAAPD